MVDKFEEIKDHEVLGSEIWFLEDNGHAIRYEKVSNSDYFNLTAIQAKQKSAQYGRKIKLFKKVNLALKAHQEMVEKASEEPGHPFKYGLLKDKFTIDIERANKFPAYNGRQIGVNELLPILQQIMTNQKEIMDAINARPEDKMLKEKFLEEFDKSMQKVLS